MNNHGTISRSYAEVDISWTQDGDAITQGSGLAGFAWLNEGVIEDSYATGDVSGRGGGLVFRNHGIIRDSYATGDVTVFGGGLVRLNHGTIDNSYATGDIGAGGGLALNNECWGTNNPDIEGGTVVKLRERGYRTICGLITNSHATGNVGGGGGLVYLNGGGIIRNSYATGNGLWRGRRAGRYQLDGLGFPYQGRLP